jgi:hypothetical protein
VTWEQTLQKIRPWLVRATGYCFCCGHKFNDILFDTT